MSVLLAFLADLGSTIAGVFLGIRLEHRHSVGQQEEAARTARGLLSQELTDDLAAAERIAAGEKDFRAMVDSIFCLKAGFWITLSRPGREAR